MESKYNELKIKIKNEIASVESICLTSDIQTHNHTMQSYIGMTAHYLKDIEIFSVEIGAQLMEDRKNIANIRKELRKICEDQGISDNKISAVVTDNGANIKGAVKEEFGSKKHISCFGHLLNNIGQRLIEINVTVESSESSDNTSTELPDAENDLDDDNNKKKQKELYIYHKQFIVARTFAKG